MISFIIPTRNEEKALGRTLGWIKELSLPHEIIVSDGGSTDRTCDIAREHGCRIVTHDGKERQTIAGGRNAGAATATGTYLAFVDADVQIPKINEFFANLLSVFQKDKGMVAATTFYRVFPEMATIGDRIVFNALGYEFWFCNNVLGIGNSSGEFQMINRSAFRKVGGYNERLVAGEDNELFYRLSKKAGKTYFARDLTIYHEGRRAHAIGWPRLLMQWALDGFMVIFTKKAWSKEWKEIR